MNKLIKTLALSVASTILLFSLAACSGNTAATSTTTTNTNSATTAGTNTSGTTGGTPIVLKVGATPVPHAEILNKVKEILAKENIDLQIVDFTDYVTPNLSLSSKEIDANFFQHWPYLDDFNKEKGTDLISVAAVHFEPLSIYAGKTTSLKDLKDGAKVAIPNDTTNEARALLLLEQEGLITIKKDAGLAATPKDIVDNPKNLSFVEMEAAAVARTLQDVDIAVINGNFALSAGLTSDKVLASESATSDAAQTYANIVAVRNGDEDRPEIKALVAAITSDEIKDFINLTYKGAVVPVFSTDIKKTVK